MAQSVLENNHLDSNENSISTKEFLQLEKSCELQKDSDEEIKLIFQEIKKLSDANCNNNFIVIETDDIELILKKAEDIAQETEGILKTDPPSGSKTPNGLIPVKTSNWTKPEIPQIKITKPQDEQVLENNEREIKCQGIVTAKRTTKENVHDVRRKAKHRPFSAGVLDSRKREVKARTVSSSPKKSYNLKQESLLEELKDTNERAKSLELLNVKLTEDNKGLRKRLAQVEEEKHLVDLKLAECENLIRKLGKEYDNRNGELKAVKENESRLLAELDRERNERKNLTLHREKDVNVIQDLQRQCKEMEMILRRKHPDSVSALIVAAKSSTIEDNKKKLLEERIARLEQELKDKEDHFQHILVTLQEKFTDMKQKYESHIIDVERQLMGDRKLNNELRGKMNKVDTVESATQTPEKIKHTIATQTRLRSADSHMTAVNRLTQNSSILLNKLKEDSYLVATIKGLQTELTTKQRTIAKINRETEELKKSLKNLRREKEVLMNLNLQKKGSRQKKSVESLIGRVNTELESELAEARQQAEMLTQERNGLLDSLKWTNEELILLKRKRIQDLHTLQLAHEKELMQMNMQLTPLQEEIQMLNRTVEILQARVRSADEKLVKYQVGVRSVEISGAGDASSTRNITKY